MKTIRITEEKFTTLKEFGHVVPSDGKPFAVGKEYLVHGLEDANTLKVRCTQNCPVSIKLIS